MKASLALLLSYNTYIALKFIKIINDWDSTSNTGGLKDTPRVSVTTETDDLLEVS